MKKNSILFIFFSITISVFFLAAIELISILVLYFQGNLNNQNDFLLKKFPVQIRLSQDLVKSVLLKNNRSTPESRDFQFDPVLHYRSNNFLTLYTLDGNKKYNGESWWDDIAKLNDNNTKWIVTLGGSTTASSQETNWPSHLIKNFKLNGVKSNIFIINAGHNGYSLSQEFIYFTYYILPNLKSRGIVISTLITLDGINDISFNIPPLINKNIQNDGYNPMYNGYSNIIYNTYSSQFKGDFDDQLTALASYYAEQTLISISPGLYTLLFDKGSSSLPNPLMKFLGAYKNNNIIFFNDIYIGIPQRLGPIDIKDFYNISPEVIYSKNLYELLEKLSIEKYSHNSKINNSELNDNKINNIHTRDFSQIKKYELSAKDIFTISNSIKNHLMNFDSFMSGAGIKNFHYNQPIVKVTNPDSSIIKDIPNFEYILVHWAMRGSDLGMPYYFDSKNIYQQLNKIYKGSNKLDLSNIFYEDNVNINIITTFDNIHYTEYASEIIAKKIVKHCMLVNKCNL